MNVIERVKNIIVTPKTEWAAIDAEPATVEEIYKSYVMPLSAIPAVIGLLAALFLKSFLPAVVVALLNYIIGLGLIYVFALVIDALAPTFGGTKNMMSAFKVAAFTPTPIWVASIAAIVPIVGLIVILAALIYAVYILYLGLPRLMRTQEDRAVPFTAVVVVIALVINIVVALVVWQLVGF